MNSVFVAGSFDDVRSRDVRFLHEAARFGALHVLVWPDDTVLELTGSPAKYPQAERVYFLQAIRYVAAVTTLESPVNPDAPPVPPGATLAVRESDDSAGKREFCRARGCGYQVLPDSSLAGFPSRQFENSAARAKVIVTGCFDWLHSGHVRFFEEASQFGNLYVVVGHDENLRLLKGDEHPLFPAEERRYMVDSVRYVHASLISTGHGWMDAAPEIAEIRPDIYLVNEDGDNAEKREFCAEHNMRYVVLKRRPKEGLQARRSTTLRGF